jgi:hypothetical protein
MHSSYPVSSYVLLGLGEELQAMAAVVEEEHILHHEPLEFQPDGISISYCFYWNKSKSLYTKR